MNGALFWLHLWTAVCAFLVGGMMLWAARSPEFRLRLGPSQRAQVYNVKLISLFLTGMGIDMAAAPFGVHTNPHIATIGFAALTGTVAATMFLGRAARRWIP